MKKRKILINGLIIAATVFLFGCVDTGKVSAFGNKDLLDTHYIFDTAVIDLHNKVETVKVRSWMDYKDSEQIQIVAEDGTVYLTSSYNCTLMKTK